MGKASVAHQDRQWCPPQQPGHSRRKWQCSAHCRWGGGPPHTPCAHGASPAERAAAQLHLHRAGIRRWKAHDFQSAGICSANFLSPAACRLYNPSEHQLHNISGMLWEVYTCLPRCALQACCGKQAESVCRFKKYSRAGCLCSSKVPKERPGLVPIIGGALPKPLLKPSGAAAAATGAAIGMPSAPGAMSKPAAQLCQQLHLRHPRPVPSKWCDMPKF